MLVINKNRKSRRKYGSGIFDTITSIATSDAVKEIGKHIAKTAATKLVDKGIEKVISSKKSKLSDKSKAILDSIIPIEKYVKGSGIKII